MNMDTISITQDVTLDFAFLDAIGDTISNAWTATVKLNDKDVLFSKVAPLYNFCHITSSPHYPQSNGQGERAVQIMKKLLKASDDSYLALLTCCTTPLPWCNLSPAQLLMGHSTLPQVEDQYKPQWQYFKELTAKFKLNQKTAYDKGHRTQSLSPIPDEEEVWITSGQSITSCSNVEILCSANCHLPRQ